MCSFSRKIKLLKLWIYSEFRVGGRPKGGNPQGGRQAGLGGGRPKGVERAGPYLPSQFFRKMNTFQTIVSTPPSRWSGLMSGRSKTHSSFVHPLSKYQYQPSLLFQWWSSFYSFKTNSQKHSIIMTKIKERKKFKKLIKTKRGKRKNWPRN